MTDLAKWRSHKIVSAGKIATIDAAGRADGPENTWLLHVLDASDEPVAIDIPAEVFKRTAPVEGDYLVTYEDGYISWSPAAAFESGYTRIEP